ncbi:hypothetical protein HAZT_HAZT007457 [Hyalella azteca]|uniref:Uncharacterized protein n=1 Tax=Hyalella azteca TaxID=294128 RepID=A0A6A0H6Y1_HYAAZ|nr:hypothetical protein HAZT_HAZT007457 [Hyalella azteca]
MPEPASRLYVGRFLRSKPQNGLYDGSLSAAAAGREALTYMLTRVGGRGGCVVVSSSGDVATPYTTARMPWAYVRDRALHWGGLVPCQHFTEALSHVSPSLRPSPQPQ